MKKLNFRKNHEEKIDILRFNEFLFKSKTDFFHLKKNILYKKTTFCIFKMNIIIIIGSSQ